MGGIAGPLFDFAGYRVKEMKPLQFLLILAILITPTTACIYEIREVVFYPNATQQVGRDWIVVNFTNPYTFDLYDVNLSYRGEYVYIPLISANSNLKIDPYKTLTPENFPLEVVSTAKREGGGVNVTFTMRNNYAESVEVNLTIPKPANFLKCVGCEVGEALEFRSEVPAYGERSFSILVSGNSVQIPDSDMSFELKSSVPVDYGVDLLISIEKEQIGDNWSAKFKIKNPLDQDVNVSFDAWYVLKIDDYTFTEREPLFNETFHLPPGGNRTFQSSLTSDKVPVFYAKARARLSDKCEVYVLPATFVEGNYIVGWATLKGFSQTLPSPGGGGGGAGGGAGGAGGGRPSSGGQVPPAQPAQPAQPQPVSLPISVSLPSLTVPEIPVEVLESYVAMMLPATYVLFMAVVFVPLMTRRGVVVTSEAVTPQNYALLRAYGRRIYSTPSNALPGSIIISPDEELVERFIDMGLERKYAESIAAAIMIKRPLVTTRRDVAEIAVRNGCIPMLLRGG
ncbi:hypothetical protein [Archaeoglobus sp.]|uniref:hypothetical protein n=1 Tax=Archaeoglobus sp. TaxID=1872626 RepID=UPI0025C58B5C|nr:hypothetical protein [Archaeoglobus sp.]